MKARHVALLLCAVLSAPLSAEVYTVYSDKGFPNVPPNQVIAYPDGGGVWDGDNAEVVPPEGMKSFKTSTAIVFNNTFFIGWGLDYAVPQNLARFNGGELRFWIYSSTGNVNVEIKSPADTPASGTARFRTNLLQNGWNWSTMHDRWVPFRMALAGVDLTSVKNPVLFTALSGPSVFYVDYVRYVDSTAASIFNVAVKNISDQQPAPGFAWSGLSGATGWARSDQYVELELDNSTDLSWGVQIYTNNSGASANPKYGGSASANPVGLINAASPSMTLPLAWSVKAAAVAPTPAEPNDGNDVNSFQWIYMKDAATPNIPSQNTTAFAPGEPAVTVKSNAGIHFGHADTEFGAENAPNYIYLQANFGSGLANQTYQTNSLIIEHFSL